MRSGNKFTSTTGPAPDRRSPARSLRTPSPTDTHSFLAGPPPVAIGPTLYRDVEYDPKRFEPVAMVAEVPYVMVASPKAPVASFAELIAYARAHPGKLNL